MIRSTSDRALRSLLSCTRTLCTPPSATAVGIQAVRARQVPIELVAKRIPNALVLPSQRAFHTTPTARLFGSPRTYADSASPSASAPPPRPRRRILRTLGRITTVLVLGAVGTYAYFVWHSSHPPDQLPQDPNKKTIVVLGSGWGATSLLTSLDTEPYNVVVISPVNYFLFTPLLPSVTVGTVDARSITQATRLITRFKKRAVQVIEAQADAIDLEKKTVTFEDTSPIHGHIGKVHLNYDYLVYAVGSENSTFGIQGVKDHACFLKEVGDAVKIRNRLMDCVESALMTGLPQEEIDRLLHYVVVGGGPTGIEYAAELRDWAVGDLKRWYPEIADRIKVTLIEALPNVLPMFSKHLIEYTESTFKQNDINIMTRSMVKDCDSETVTIKTATGEIQKIPYGLLVWAAGNTTRQLTRDLQAALPGVQTERRGLKVDDHMRLLGATDSIFALGDATATAWAPTAQAASQQGTYLAKVFAQLARSDELEKKIAEARQNGEDTSLLEKQLQKAQKIRPFQYSHQGSLAYVGSDRAIADLPWGQAGNLSSAGVSTYIFWRSAYFSMLFSLRNRSLVAMDWISA
ncbi:NADH:ubiquinone oxidoreductase [Tilletia horrida]|nr:NADH:ubiquinone oxidoreductase [Tilletia horrida]